MPEHAGRPDNSTGGLRAGQHAYDWVCVLVQAERDLLEGIATGSFPSVRQRWTYKVGLAQAARQIQQCFVGAAAATALRG
jgi:hypothetical protein